MSRRSLATPIIVAVLVTLATGLTFSTAGSSPGPATDSTRRSTEMPVSGVIVARGLDDAAAAELSDTFPGWPVDVSRQRAATPVVVVALRSDARRWRPYLLRRAVEVLPARTTVAFQPLAGDVAADRRRARRTADLLTDDEDPRHRR